MNPTTTVYPAHLKDILFIDIETVSLTQRLEELNEEMQAQWQKKSWQLTRDPEVAPTDSYRERAAIYAEFGKVVCIGLGILHMPDAQAQPELRLTVLQNHNEKQLLQDFADMLLKLNNPRLQLCGHNGKEFDFPYLCRRFLINQLPLPAILNMAGKKPWEINHIDTLELWKFGDYKSYTSLSLLAAVFNIPTSKDDIDGSQVGEVYYKQQDLSKIARYCQEDVRVTAQVYLALSALPVIQEESIIRKALPTEEAAKL